MCLRLVVVLGLFTTTALFAQPSDAQPSAATPVALAYSATLGQTDLPWQRSNAFLNQPWGLGADRDGVWIANGAGRNLVRFGSSASEDLGRTGDPAALYGAPVRFLADVAVVSATASPVLGTAIVPAGTVRLAVPDRQATVRPGQMPDGAAGKPLPTATRPSPGAGPPARTVWFVDSGGHVAVGIPLAPDGTTGKPTLLGETDVPGDDTAHLHGPSGIAAGMGTVFVSDTQNHRVQVFQTDGTHLATIGRTGLPGSGTEQLNRPARLALTADGRLYIADSGNHRIVAYDVRDPAAPRHLQSYGRTGEPGPGDEQFDTPLGVAVDATFLYVADGGNGRVQILRWRDGQHFGTLNGTTPARCGGPDGRWDRPSDVAVDESGNLYVALPRRMVVLGCDALTRAHRADLSHGAPETPYMTRDELHNAPVAVAVAGDGSVAVVEGEGQRVVARRPDGTVAWTVGKPGVPGAGSAESVRFDRPADAAYLPDGRLVVADTGNARLVVLGPDGAFGGEWGVGHLGEPTGLTVLADGTIWVADGRSGRVHRLDGNGADGGDLAGPDGRLAFTTPADVAVDRAGNYFVSERALHRVTVLDRTGRRIRELGEPGVPGDDFGHFRSPMALAIDAASRLVVVDSGGDRVQVFHPDGTYATTVAGRHGVGTGGLAEPRGVAVGPEGGLYVADTYNHRVQVFTWAVGPWGPAAASGLGDRAVTAVEALAEMDGWLYAGLRSSRGAAIWRRQGDGAWQAVAVGGFGDRYNLGVTALAVFRGQLYAGAENVLATPDPATGRVLEASTGGGVWRSDDGTSWGPVVSGGFGDANQCGVGPFTVFDGQLYAATRSVDRAAGGPQLWRSPSGDAGSWQRSRIDLYTRTEWPKNGAISALGAFSNTLYAGTCAQDRAQLWASTDGTAWRPVGYVEPGADPLDGEPQLGGGPPCVTSLLKYGGHLYAALGTDAHMGLRLGRVTGPPVELWRCARCDGTDWDTAAGAGFGERQHRGSVTLMSFDEPPFSYLYAFVGNPIEGLDAWRAPDGLDWDEVAGDGFGDDNNTDPGGGGAVAIHRERLYVGTVNLASGGELWSSPGTRPGIVPTPPGPTATPTPRPSPRPPTGQAHYDKVDEWPVNEPAPADVLGSPVDMAVAPDGAVYLLASAPARVLHLRADRAWGQPFGGTGSGPDRLTRTTDSGARVQAGMALDAAAGRLYVSDLGTERLLAYDRQGNYQGTVLESAYIVDVAVRADGTLWVADRLAGGVRRVAGDGAEIERLGRYGPWEPDGFEGLVAVAEEPGGRLWVADQGGDRLRAYERDSAERWVRTRTVDMGQASLAANRCTGSRLQVLGAGALLAGPCILADGRFLRGLPASHRGSDLYGVTLHTADPVTSQYFALATYDLDRSNLGDETYPTVVRYVGEGFDVVSDYWLGRPFGPGTAADNTLLDPSRIDALAGGDLLLVDSLATSGKSPFIRRFDADGRVLAKLPMRGYPSRHYSLTLDDRLVVSTGEPGRFMGVAELRQGRGTHFEVLVYGQSVRRRYCSARACSWGEYIEPTWQTSLVNLSQSSAPGDYSYAATFEPTRRQYVLLQLWSDSPSDVALRARLYLFPLEQRGRKTEVTLDGSERQALWTDVDAGPDGRIYVLDALNDRIQVIGADGTNLGRIDSPGDAWKVAGGPNAEVFVLTHYGHVVRLAADGTELSRFLGLPNGIAPPTAQADLAVDAWGRVYVIDNLYDLVTTFETEGLADDVLEGARCQLGDDKWVAPDEILLGTTAELFLELSGTCGFVEEAADIVLAINAAAAAEVDNLRVSRQILAVVNLDRHRAGVVSFVDGAQIEQRLTHSRANLIRSLFDLTSSRTTCGGANNEAALRVARDVFDDSPPGKRKVLILIDPDAEPAAGTCPWSDESIALAADGLRAEGVTILAVNDPSLAASGQVLSDIAVAERGPGVGRPAIRRAMGRTWPADLVRTGTLVDTLPANVDYIAGSARPPAAWDDTARTLTWPLTELKLGAIARFTLSVRPSEEGLWPTNIGAVADVIDGWGQVWRLVLPDPKIRVYAELPPTPTITATATPSPTVTPTPRPVLPLYLPALLRIATCSPETQAADVALLIDTSGSMSTPTSPGGPTKLAAARDAARWFLSLLTAGRDQAAVIQFDNAATVIEPLTPDITRAAAGLERLTQAVGTRIDLALDAAVVALTGPERRPLNNPVIILLTDGAPTGVTPEEVQVAADRAKAAGMLVYTIGLGPDVNQVLLRDIATQPEWHYLAPDTADLAEIYRRIAYSIPCKPSWP